jgi:hypothetical protein
MVNLVLDDRIRVAIDSLMKAQPLLMSAISELTQQGYTTEATNLSNVLTDLILRTDQAKAAIH